MLLSQEQYAQAVLKQLEMDSAETALTPMVKSIDELLVGTGWKKLDENRYPYELLIGRF